MEQNRLTIPALILAAALIITGLILVTGVFRIQSLSNTISVTGSAEQRITSDVAKWTIQISHSTDLTGLKEGNAGMDRDRSALLAYLEEQEISSDAITVQPMMMESMTDWNQGGKLVGYTLRQIVTVESPDVSRVKKAMEEAGILINEGALVSTISLEYFYTGLANLKQEILAAATEDARARAEKMVEAAQSRLGSLRAASMGVLQVTAVNSVEVADYGMYDTSALEKKVTAVVRASFGIR